MMSFRGSRLEELLLPQSTVWMLETLAEAKGRQQLHEHQSPQLLEALREMALVESAESSNLKGPFGIADVERACPSVGRDMIRRVMNRWRAEGKLEMLSRGRDAQWQRPRPA